MLHRTGDSPGWKMPGSILEILQAEALLGSTQALQKDALLRHIKHQAGYQPRNKGHRLSAESGKKLPQSEHMKA